MSVPSTVIVFLKNKYGIGKVMFRIKYTIIVLQNYVGITILRTGTTSKTSSNRGAALKYRP